MEKPVVLREQAVQILSISSLDASDLKVPVLVIMVQLPVVIIIIIIIIVGNEIRIEDNLREEGLRRKN